MLYKYSHAAFEAANHLIPGGVNSPVRAFKAVGGTPRFIQSASGSHITDIDGNTYIDYVGSWGPMIVGHAHPDVLKAVQDAMQYGLSFGAPTQAETTLAGMIVERVPHVEQVRFCSSGTEATMSAIRLARGVTERDTIIKFEGCYHGHSDSLLVKAGSGALTHGVPTSAGVPTVFAEKTVTLPYNDVEALTQAFADIGEQLACVIVEPIAGNMNLIVPHTAFIQAIRTGCNQTGALFIADEVMTGFRVAKAGASELLNFTPDISTFGKVIGGGMPVGAFAASEAIMSHLSPLGGVYQAGTLSGNPVAMAAGIATLALTERDGFYPELAEKTRYFAEGMQRVADEAGIAFLAKHVCGMFGCFFTDKTNINGYADVMACDNERFNRFFHLMLDACVYLAPASYEAGFMSMAHSQADIDQTLAAAKYAFEHL